MKARKPQPRNRLPKTATRGLDGTFQDSCVVCMRGTDTALCFRGEAEFAIGGYVVMGIPWEHAKTLLEMYCRDNYGTDPGMVRKGEIDVIAKVCAECAGELPVGLAAGDIPVITPKPIEQLPE